MNWEIERGQTVSEETKVLIVDDHPVFRQGLRDVLETDPKLTVIGEAADGEVALELVQEISPDVILMDIEQVGGIACHTGRESCFYKQFNNGEWQTADAVIKDPKDIYK